MVRFHHYPQQIGRVYQRLDCHADNMEVVSSILTVTTIIILKNMNKNFDINVLLKQREKAKRLEHKWSQKVTELEEIIRVNCDHPKTETTSCHIEGGYLNVAEYHKIKKCLICKKEVDRKVTYGSYA
jgi:hypothetical protein